MKTDPNEKKRTTLALGVRMGQRLEFSNGISLYWHRSPQRSNLHIRMILTMPEEIRVQLTKEYGWEKVTKEKYFEVEFGPQKSQLIKE